MSPELIDWIWRAVIGLVIGLILYAVKDWRRTRAENRLAEATHQPKVNKTGIEALEAQILAMSQAWDEERASKDRRITALKEEQGETKDKLATAEGTIVELHERARIMQKHLESLQEQLTRVTALVETKGEVHDATQ